LVFLGSRRTPPERASTTGPAAPFVFGSIAGQWAAARVH
jgi:hypothetical protein